MKKALLLAEKAANSQEVPVGALLVRDELIIGEGWNQPIGSCDPSAHAEVMALRAAGTAEKNYRLPNTTLYVTIEPCSMCLGALMHARVEHIVFGAKEPKAGVLDSNVEWQSASFFNHHLSWRGGVCEQECSALISDFFSRRRNEKKALKNLARPEK
ncbi:tRNA(Arg) A34 adenosine deaminase TadA [Alteromonadaceae bacterium Bs31]|nr:tRNA(Arg) A34 adenosine deaminase TadA [Alteromonadaceae bacterium Bs31]